MADIVVTVPKQLWAEWIGEGDLPGDVWAGRVEYHFYLVGARPKTAPGERVYIVAHGKLRGYAPFVRIDNEHPYARGGYGIVRHGGAVAVTIPEPIRGFQGWRYAWWDRAIEVPFPEWGTP